MDYSLNSLYQVVGISKQAVSQYEQRQVLFNKKIQELILDAEEIRAEHPGCGVEKLYHTLKPEFIGRDRFIETFMSLGFRVKKKKNYRRTTFSSKRLKYPNIIQGVLINYSNQIWQSDITYYDIGNRFYYIIFIIDVYTKVIVGHRVSDHLKAIANLKALKIAFKNYGMPKVHHSDRGTQYTCKKYCKLLKDNKVEMSLCDSAMDNAYAERINQTIKNEYLRYWKPTNYRKLVKMTAKAVESYNHKRIHNNLNRQTPIAFSRSLLNLPAQERPTAIIYTDGQQIAGSQRLPAYFTGKDLGAQICPINI